MARLSTTLTDDPWDGVTAKEFTVAELDLLLNAAEKREQEDKLAKDNNLPAPDRTPSTLDWLLIDDQLTEEMLCTSTGVSKGDLQEKTMSELAPLIKAVQEVNPAFFQRALADAKRKEQLLQSVGKLSGTTQQS